MSRACTHALQQLSARRHVFRGALELLLVPCASARSISLRLRQLSHCLLGARPLPLAACLHCLYNIGIACTDASALADSLRRRHLVLLIVWRFAFLTLLLGCSL